jgi:hypothetical protein
MVNISSAGMRVVVDPASSALLVVGDVVDTTLGAGPTAVDVHARIANVDGSEIGLQLFITDDRQAARIEEYVGKASS